MDANVVGLILNLTGVIILLISSRSQNHILGRITKHLFSNSSNEQLASEAGDQTELERVIKTSGQMGLVGLGFFVIGFGLQIICLQFNCFQ